MKTKFKVGDIVRFNTKSNCSSHWLSHKFKIVSYAHPHARFNVESLTTTDELFADDYELQLDEESIIDRLLEKYK